nr:unnamed protein product [Callosobruchus chinensis]
MEKYEQLSVIGEGSYGIVTKCRHKDSNEIVAIKKFLETEEDGTIRKMALREIRMLKRLRHENLVTLIEVFRHRKRFYLVFEYVAGTVLDELERHNGGLDYEMCRERIFQVTRAVAYCHYNNIIHRDVKPENVLVSNLGVVKLCDFGFARLIANMNEACTEYVATRWYRAPELLVGDLNYSSPVDVWAIGCLFAEIMTGDPLFPGESDIDQFYLIVKLLGRPSNRLLQLASKNARLKTALRVPDPHSSSLQKRFSSWTPLAIDFLSSCLRMDPTQRLTCEDMLKHRYFTHDRFPQRFLPSLRSKVNTELSTPLLRKLKTEIIMSTDKRDENRSRRPTQSNWIFSLKEGSMKRKFSGDTSNSEGFSSMGGRFSFLEKVTMESHYKDSLESKQSHASQNTQQRTKPKAAEMQMLEKSLQSLARLNNNPKPEQKIRPSSAQRNATTQIMLTDSPPHFHSLHFGIGDYNHNKSPTGGGQNVLHPAISNISFSREPQKRSPINIGGSIGKQLSQTPLLSNPRSNFLQKMDRNLVVENIYATGDHHGQSWGVTPVWLSGIATPATLKKREQREPKSKSEEFTLPNLPGVTTTPEKPKKKSLPEIELPHSTEISPEYRYRKAKRKRITVDISLPVLENHTPSIL